MNKNKSLSKKTILLLCLVLFQIIVVLANGLFGYWYQHSEKPSLNIVTTYSLVGGFIVGLTTVFFVIEIVRLGSKECELVGTS